MLDFVNLKVTLPKAFRTLRIVQRHAHEVDAQLSTVYQVLTTHVALIYLLFTGQQLPLLQASLDVR